jgi:hypothetical protein
MRNLKIAATAFGMLAIATLYFNCGQIDAKSYSAAVSANNINGEDTSASGVAAAAIGGAIATSSQTGTFAHNSLKQNLLQDLIAPEAQADTDHCPTMLSSGTGSNCANDLVNVGSVLLTYDGCSFGTALAKWTGIERLTLVNGVALHCGTFPVPTGTSIQRQFVDSTGAAATATRVDALGFTITIDNAATNGTLNNFDGFSIVPTIGTGYGTAVTFDANNLRTQVAVNEHLQGSGPNGTTFFDHTIMATVNISESGGTRTVTGGTVQVYHNLLQIIGTSTFTNVKYTDSCCTPMSGEIDTTFSAGQSLQPTTAGLDYVNKTEKMTFNSCGNVTLTDVSGNISNLTLSCF